MRACRWARSRIWRARAQASLESFVQVVAALGLVEDLGELFRIKMVSIAAMEQAEKANRQRAPRKPAK